MNVYELESGTYTLPSLSFHLVAESDPGTEAGIKFYLKKNTLILLKHVLKDPWKFHIHSFFGLEM